MASRVRIDRIKFATALLKADINMKELSERSGMSRTTISAVKQEKSCSPETAQKLADGLGVKLESLL